MKNILILLLFLATTGISLATEPITDTADIMSGATNSTYNTEIDIIAGASENNESSEESVPTVGSFGG